MRYREDKPGDLARAREEVAAWRQQNPRGTAGQLVADLGGRFHKDYGPVLRSVLFALELHEAKETAMTHLGLTGRADPLIRRKLFEHAHPEVTIVPPGTLNDPWRAIVRPGTVPGDPTATTISSWQLAGLMDQLDGLLQAGGDPDPEPGHAGR